MVECDLCGKETKTSQGMRGHFRFAHGVERSVDGISNPVERSSFVTEAALEEVLSEQLGGIGDLLIGAVTDKFRPQIEEKLRELAAPILAELADLRGRVNELEAAQSGVVGLTHLLASDILPALERRLEAKQDVPREQRILIRNGRVPEQVASSAMAPCGHEVPCDDFDCLADRLKVLGECGHPVGPGEVECAHCRMIRGVVADPQSWASRDAS